MDPTTQPEAAGAMVWSALEVPLAPGDLDRSQIVAGRRGLWLRMLDAAGLGRSDG
ncbi:MAG TPA: hypothetical protein VNC60_09310 [Actinomycetota bacterium]|nr:hypothetical protein [Actinomycetota bacterium]